MMHVVLVLALVTLSIALAATVALAVAYIIKEEPGAALLIGSLSIPIVLTIVMVVGVQFGAVTTTTEEEVYITDKVVFSIGRTDHYQIFFTTTDGGGMAEVEAEDFGLYAVGDRVEAEKEVSTSRTLFKRGLVETAYSLSPHPQPGDLG